MSSLHHVIDLEWMKEAYRLTRKDGAPGIDGVMAADYATNLEANLLDLLDRIKSGRYKAPPVRRTYIDRCLTATVQTFVSVRPASQQRRTAAAAIRTNKSIRPPARDQKCRATLVVGKILLELGERSRPSHRISGSGSAVGGCADPRYYNLWLPEATG